MVGQLPRNADLADRFDLLADLSEILGEQSLQGRPRTVGPRRGIRDTASSVAELALEGRAKELPDIGKTIEAKIVEVVETGDMEALAKRRAARSRARWPRSCGSPGSARRRGPHLGASSG